LRNVAERCAGLEIERLHRVLEDEPDTAFAGTIDLLGLHETLLFRAGDSVTGREPQSGICCNAASFGMYPVNFASALRRIRTSRNVSTPETAFAPPDLLEVGTNSLAAPFHDRSLATSERLSSGCGGGGNAPSGMPCESQLHNLTLSGGEACSAMRSLTYSTNWAAIGFMDLYLQRQPHDHRVRILVRIDLRMARPGSLIVLFVNLGKTPVPWFLF
jgi:hypothetical protein